ncbi:hypothetical protein [Marinoscillum sp. 108]|uniref:hypothetical protein n=1 Tax=Marinoscillum sp. 108 TaxID=2653151 RepID=UPI0012F04E34|nr:hypothetical protein [Marinoscillum sp. 108]VXD18943.1 hypothetical protein MARINOS108_20478 [Marinoscillum sp. 108]
MTISFENIELLEVCEKEEHALKAFGEETSRRLFARISDLMSVEFVSEIPLGNPRTYGEATDQLMINIDENYVLVFGPAHPKNPYLENGQLDWSKIYRIKVLKIEKLNANSYLFSA